LKFEKCIRPRCCAAGKIWLFKKGAERSEFF
jgi:hypothetical protein